MSIQEWSEERPLHRSRSARFTRAARTPRTPRTPRAQSPRKGDDPIAVRSSKNRVISARDVRSACSRRASLTQRPAFSIY
ncbi:unnamed protein product [Euphydryas editha]|uniref:Uncharacterized protein n=1 Tax=Euphydryas editha TaxID=104508 RepID=A0AAU9THE6_EUPED|nr:unnamed protein product [Euphydryas editha]